MARPNEQFIEAHGDHYPGKLHLAHRPLMAMEIPQFLAENKAQAKAFAREHAVLLPDNVQYGVDRAQQEAAILQKKLFGHFAPSGEVIFLKPEDFETFYRMVSGVRSQQYIASVAGVFNVNLDDVYVRYDDKKNALSLSATTFHELIHRDIDVSIRVFSQWPSLQLGNAIVKIFQSRTGLFLQGRLGNRGELLNEIGNHLLEKQFVDKLIQEETFVGEKHAREVACEKLLIDRGLPKKAPSFVTSIEGHGENIRIDIENCEFTSSGEWLLHEGLLKLQLGSDISKAVGRIDGEDFTVALLTAKARPKYQNVIREHMDATLGAGFYSKLRNAQYNTDAIMNLLVEVQAHKP